MHIDRDPEEDNMKIILAALALATSALPVAAAPPPASVYQSTTADYTPYREAAMADWRGANEEMARLNGHMGHMGRGHMGSRSDQPMNHDMLSTQPTPKGMGSHHHPMGGKP